MNFRNMRETKQGGAVGRGNEIETYLKHDVTCYIYHEVIIE